MPTVEVRGTGPRAAVYDAASRSLGWHTSTSARPADFCVITSADTHLADADRHHHHQHLLVVAPLHDALVIDRRAGEAGLPGRRLFGWPLVTAPTTQEMVRRARRIGTPTKLTLSSTRPRLDTTDGAPDIDEYVALALLIARFVGSGSPAVTQHSASDTEQRLSLAFEAGASAVIEATSGNDVGARSSIQLSGPDGVLRIDSDPTTALEHDGEPVQLPRRPRDDQARALHDAGVTDLLKTAESLFRTDAPTPHALTFDFARDVAALTATDW